VERFLIEALHHVFRRRFVQKFQIHVDNFLPGAGLLQDLQERRDAHLIVRCLAQPFRGIRQRLCSLPARYCNLGANKDHRCEVGKAGFEPIHQLFSFTRSAGGKIYLCERNRDFRVLGRQEVCSLCQLAGAIKFTQQATQLGKPGERTYVARINIERFFKRSLGFRYLLVGKKKSCSGSQHVGISSS